MILSALLQALLPTQIVGSSELKITSIADNSRLATAGTLFVAIAGTQVDGHTYIEKAIAQGAVVVVCQLLPTTIVEGVTYIVVTDSAEALGLLASAWYGNPSKEITLVGVTGTNGKTTTATLLYEMARLFGYKAGLLSTVCNYIDSEAVPATHTTPDPLQLHELLRRMVDAGCDYAFMEVSSHSAHQRRIAGLDFDGGLFSNLTRDHMDYHQTVDAYLKAKKMFFDGLKPEAFALTNADDKTGMVMLQNCRASKHTYSLRTVADYKGRIIESRLDGTTLLLNDREVEVQFVGKFNAYNLLSVYGASLLLGWDAEQTLINMSLLVPVAGRFQTLHSPSGCTVIIDYAHTPDALTNVLSTVRDVIGAGNQLITVVGAGGNRDKGKRPLMAKEAAIASDRVVLTSDNPRFEEPQDIINDMLAGLTGTHRQKTFAIADRAEAIRTALMLAQRGDVVVVAGKGHEDYQEVKGVKHHFDDREVVENLFKETTI